MGMIEKVLCDQGGVLEYIIDAMITSLLYMCDWTIPTSNLWSVGMSHG